MQKSKVYLSFFHYAFLILSFWYSFFIKIIKIVKYLSSCYNNNNNARKSNAMQFRILFQEIE